MYTCITCQVAFVDPDLQRAHYKTDWHRYNLKRKVAELPPVTADGFQERVLAQRTVDASKLQDKHSQYCDICRKQFVSDKSYESHLRSRKHKELEKRKAEKNTTTPQGTDEKETTKIDVTKEKEVIDEPEEANSDDDEPLETNECLFCSHFEEDMERNLKHMSSVHGFFLPDLEYLENLEGLMRYLAEKVGVGYMCLYCNEKGKMFLSVEAAQHHMVDKSHCKLYFEGDAALEFAEYYDYSKSYPDNGEHSPDDEVVHGNNLKVNEDMELVLPSGTTVGHRLLKTFYRQNPPSYERRRATLAGRVMSQYRAIGWKDSQGDNTHRRIRDVGWSHRMKQQRQMKLGCKANKMQPYLRPQVVF